MKEEIEKIQKRFPNLNDKRCRELLNVLGSSDEVIEQLEKYENQFGAKYKNINTDVDDNKLSENIKYIKYDSTTYNSDEIKGGFIDEDKLDDYFNDILNGKININRDITKSIMINNNGLIFVCAISFILWIIFLFINFKISIILLVVWVLCIVFIVFSKKEKLIFEKCIPLINEIADKSMNEYYNFLKENRIKEKNISSALVERTNIDILENEKVIQYYLDENGITLYSLPLYKLTLWIGLDKYIIPIFSKENAEKMVKYKTKDIDKFTYYGSELIETDVNGGGYDLGGALLGGFLFGGVGAVIGSREEIKTTSKKLDLREVQINFKGKKTIVLKSFDIYKELMTYFSDKEIVNKFNKQN